MKNLVEILYTVFIVVFGYRTIVAMNALDWSQATFYLLMVWIDAQLLDRSIKKGKV